jgi:DNA-binding transcriptional MerR regulator
LRETLLQLRVLRLGLLQDGDVGVGVFPEVLLTLDSGLRSRLYDSVMAANHQFPTPTLQIGEVARRTALTVDAIRFYEKRSLLPKAMRTTGRFRLYTADDIERIRFIGRMQALGFSLGEIRELGSLRARSVDACESVRKLLTEKLSEVRRKMREFERLESELAADLRKCKAELRHRRKHAPAACPVLGTSGREQE